MPAAPTRPKVYHITHVKNLSSIIGDGELLSDAEMRRRGGPASDIGISDIKERRLSLPVTCHPGTTVGEYVPFNWCPRSVMLFVIYRQNHDELQYKGGQGPIIHLELDVDKIAEWASALPRRIAFTDRNAGAYYTSFEKELVKINAVLDWEAIQSNDFRDREVKELKQAEFLVYRSVPWVLVSRIGVRSERIRHLASQIVQGSSHQPPVTVEPSWYY